MEVESIEVDRYCEESRSRNESWTWKAEGNECSNSSCHDGNLHYAEHNGPFVRPLRNKAVYLKGDVLIIDPFKIFFMNPKSGVRRRMLLRQLQELQQEGHMEFLVMYRGCPAYFICSEMWDQDAAFEISRSGTSLGVDEVPSRFIAVVTKKMVDLLGEENGEGLRLEGGVPVKDVDGQLIRSGDGDFVISGSGATSPVRKVSRWIEDECVHVADVLCATGGRWTFCDDSSDEEDEDDSFSVADEEVMKYLT
ncbi:unnamed protein product [Calypogeia fissa]